MFRCPHAYPSASSPFTLKKTKSPGTMVSISRPVIGPFSMAGLLGSRCFSERLREGKGEMRVFPKERWFPKEVGIRGDCWLDSDSFWAN